MSQASITSFFNTRKRAAGDSLIGSKHKLMRIDSDASDSDSGSTVHVGRQLARTSPLVHNDIDIRNIFSPKLDTENGKTASTGLKRTRLAARQGNCQSPSKKKASNFRIQLLESELKKSNVEMEFKTPTKEEQQAKVEVEKKIEIRKKLTLDDVKSKLTKSDKLDKLKASMNRLKQLEETRQSARLKNTTPAVAPPVVEIRNETKESPNKTLKHFQSIELEVLTSPKKQLSTPTKQIIAPASEDVLMSPKKTTPTQVFSPSKTVPAYKAFQNLAETSGPTLQLPYKYRCLAEVFRCLDTICAMYFNRKEVITMKKLKPAVQRLLRKNFSETHLAQIKSLYPEAFNFSQRKMLNAGSLTKYDYYQLVIGPRLEKTAKDKTSDPMAIDSQMMTPQNLIKRQQHFTNILLNLVKCEHDKFLKSLDPPMNIPMNKITRWHPEFDLQNCPDIKCVPLPEPPNVDKFSSAKDVLSTARNLFNSYSPSIRSLPSENNPDKKPEPTDNGESKPENPIDSVLKNIPKSLLDKIREKQAARARENMTRRPSQDQTLSKFTKLPELARHLRNIFVTENKSVLDLDTVLNKIENSYREKIPRKELRELLELMANELDKKWITFHFIRKTDFVKINKSASLSEIIAKLQAKADDKLK